MTDLDNVHVGGSNLKEFLDYTAYRNIDNIKHTNLFPFPSADCNLSSHLGSYADMQLGSYYIPPETAENADLKAVVLDWLSQPSAPPLFVLAPYGKGKTTFARHLAAAMAQEALDDPLKRVPLLFPLGEIVNEQSLDGLFGKVLASQHRVENYHYETVRELNRLGRFLIIYDGFDEMKHGMTIDMFQQVMAELMKVDEGDARILVLGRDTAFHDDHEFKLIIEGKQRTSAGLEVATMNRRAYRHVELRGFSGSESHRYVKCYFPILVERAGKSGHRTDEWVEGRIAELLSGRFNDLLERPVHAEMLCQIALEPKALDPAMTVSQLYDTFVHYLLQRELEKPGRLSSFAIPVRRKFNASLAWWLWERGGASTTTLNDIPQALCDDAAKDVDHRMAREELRRELIQGCLVEKGGSTIYFGHRSLQEFLVAEHLIDTNLLQSLGEKPSWLARFSAALTPEVASFIHGSLGISPSRADRVGTWLQGLGTARADDISQIAFEFLVGLWRGYRPLEGKPSDSIWHMWLEYCLRTERPDFSYHYPGSVGPLGKLFAWADENGSREAQAAAMMVAARNLLTQTSDQGKASVPIAAILPVSTLGAVVRAAQSEKSARQTVRREENYRLWSLLRSWTVVQSEGEDVRIEINALRLLDDAEDGMACTFSRDGLFFDGPILSTTPQQIYQALSMIDSGFDDRKIDAIRPYFNSPDVRKRIGPLVVEHRKARTA